MPAVNTRIDQWLEVYRNRWLRYVRRYDRQLPIDAPIRHDMRFWEARACSIPLSNVGVFLWFFFLDSKNRYELYKLARELRSVRVTLLKKKGDLFARSGN